MGVHVLVLHQGDGFQAAAHHTLHAVVQHLLGGGGHRHQARGTLAVHGHAGGGHWQAGAQGDLPSHVAAGGALLQGGTHDHVLHPGGVDPGALDGFRHRGGPQGGAPKVVEATAIGLADGGTCGRNNHCICHAKTPLLPPR